MTQPFPLISCICPTANRGALLARSVAYFEEQDYPNKELIILEDGDEMHAHDEPHVIYHYSMGHLSIGMKRNLACQMAHGEIITSWDDDDYYGPGRLSKQVAPLLSGKARASALRLSLLLDARAGTLWMPSDETHRRCFKQDIHYGTLMFQAAFFQQGLRFADVQVGEDVRFVHALLAEGVQIARIVSPANYIYVLHGGNTTSDMRLVHPEGWQQVPLSAFLWFDEQLFYQQFQDIPDGETVGTQIDLNLIGVNDG